MTALKVKRHNKIQNQLSLIPEFELGLILESANTLIDMLNDNRPKKEIYYPQWYLPHNQYWVFIASNSNKDILFNVLDQNGKIPNGLPANWRTYPHIKNEIGL